MDTMTETNSTTYLDFNDYDSYIQRRTEWRKDYAQISQEIRDWKNSYRSNASMEAKAYYRFVKRRGISIFDCPTPYELLCAKRQDFDEWVVVKRQLPFRKVGDGTRSSSDAFNMLKIRALMKKKSSLQREGRVSQFNGWHSLPGPALAA